MARRESGSEKRESKFDTIKSLQRDFLTCGICLDHFNVPKTLTCLHRFCEACLKDYVASLSIRPGNKFQCPLKCTERTILPSGGVAGIKTDFNLTGLDEFLTLKGSQRKKERKRVDSLFDQDGVRCEKHDQKRCELFCEEEGCLYPVCVKCISTDHKGHHATELKEFAVHRTALETLAKSVQEHRNLAVQKHDLYSSTLLLIEEGSKASDSTIDQYVEEMKKKIDQEAVELKGVLSSMFQRQFEDIWSLTRNSQKQIEALDHLMDEITEGVVQTEPRNLKERHKEAESKFKEISPSVTQPETVVKFSLKTQSQIELHARDLLELVVSTDHLHVTCHEGELQVTDLGPERSGGRNSAGTYAEPSEWGEDDSDLDYTDLGERFNRSILRRGDGHSSMNYENVVLHHQTLSSSGQGIRRMPSPPPPSTP